MKLGVNIDRAGTFLFKLPEDSSEKITKRHIRTNMVGWLFHDPATLDYVFLLPIERFVISTDTNNSIYDEETNPLLEVTKDEAQNFYTMLAQKQEKAPQKVHTNK